MSLIRFLAAGRCLMGKDTSLGRYRFDKHFRLPQFGSTKNPFETPKQSEPAAEPKPVSVPPEKTEPALPPVTEPTTACPQSLAGEPASASQKIQKPVAERQPATFQKTQRLPEAVPAKVGKRGAWLQKTSASLLAGLKYLAVKLNPLSWFSRRGKRAKAASAKPEPATDRTKLPQQPELSLENVKVVRNDLQETDFEVVAVKTAADSDETPAAKLKRKAMMHQAPSQLVQAGQT